MRNDSKDGSLVSICLHIHVQTNSQNTETCTGYPPFPPTSEIRNNLYILGFSDLEFIDGHGKGKFSRVKSKKQNSSRTRETYRRSKRK